MHPYKFLDERAFWSPAVGKRSYLDIDQLWEPKWRIKAKHKIVTYGSCFAQHFGRALAARRYDWHSTERPPRVLSDEQAKNFNYGVFSSRTANIYTVSLLKQWMEWATGKLTPPDEYWETDGRIYDPFRPTIEPDGFESVEEMRLSRELTIEAFLNSMKEADIFVFTLGLTESWFNKQNGYEYPMCPGTAAGEFNDEMHQFRNQNFLEIRRNLNDAIKLLREVNPKVKVLLTVSPVPLTATNSGQHVLVATMRSKSILRGVAAELAEAKRFVDYFPSYEIISSPVFGGAFFESNKRSVMQDGVNFVMKSFFSCLNAKFPDRYNRMEAELGSDALPPEQMLVERNAAEKAADDLVCEEELLSAFASEARVKDAGAST